MNITRIVKELEEEIKGNNRKDFIKAFEEQLINVNVEELSKNENFFTLPLKNIFSVISKFDFIGIEENDKILETIQNIIKNIINKHFDEKETLLILQNLNFTKTLSFSTYEEIFSLLEIIRNCPILVHFCQLYQERNKEVDIDYEYELQQKDNEIEKLKQQIPKEFPPITEKPTDYEPDIFKACKEGKLTSIQWLIEKENEDKNKKVEEDEDKIEDTPIHIASKFGHLRIVQYLIEKQNVDIDIKGNEGRTPLHYASLKGYLPIVEYLLSKGANIEAKDSYYGQWTPLHYASNFNKINIVKYLISKGADKNAKDYRNRTPSDLTDIEEIKDILK